MKRFTQIFILIMLAELVAIYNHDTYPWLEYISKPLIVISLILFVVTYTKGVKLPFKKWLILALVFAWFGDMFLMFVDFDSNFFLYGLIAFLICQVFYIIAFTIPAHKPLDIPLYKKHPWTLLVPYGYAAFIYSELKGDLGDMSAPVLIYVIVITTMLAVAMNRYGKVSNSSYTWILFGAIFFVASDSIIAIDKFHHSIEYSRYLIMFTYMSAQYFIVRGGIRQIEEQSSN